MNNPPIIEGIFSNRANTREKLRHLPVIKCPALLPRITYCADRSTNKGWTFYFLDLPKEKICRNTTSF